MVRTAPESRNSHGTPVATNLQTTRHGGVISDEAKTLINRLLLERSSLAGIVRAVQVSESRLHAYVNEKYQDVAREVRVRITHKVPIDDCM